MTIDPRSETRAALSGLLDRFTILALTLGVVSAGLGLLRITSQGWHANVVTDLSFFIPMVAVLLLRRRLPIEVVIAVLTALVSASAVASFLTLGLGTMSFVGLTACCVVVGVAFGMRWSFVYLGGAVVVVGTIGVAICTGRVTWLQVTDPFLFQPQTWATQIAGFAAYTAVIIVVGGTLNNRLSNSLNAVTLKAAELRESERRYRLLADNMRDVLFLQDLDFSVVYVSPSVERMFGYTQEEFLQIDVRTIFTKQSAIRANDSYSRALEMVGHDSVESPPLELEYVRKDGSTFWGEVAPTFLLDADGGVVGVQGMLRDITDRRKIEEEREALERELRQAEKLNAIGQLAGGIAHDFNNQLAPIMAHADMIARGLVDSASVADHAQKIINPARNAADLTAKLLAFARKGSYEHRSLDLHEVINEVAEILVHGIDRRISVKRLYEAPSATVEGDRTQLQNVLLNLALNARDAMPDGGEIVFRTAVRDEPGDQSDSAPWLEILVEDTGEGMDDSVRERAFEPFFTTKALGKGTGMGLAAAYGTVASHGGTIEIASRPGAGTTVCVRLPMTAVETGVRSESFAENLASAGGQVLVVDDEDGVRSALTDLLEALGFSVIPFGRATEATAFFSEHAPEIDLIILDLVLPDMNGREALGVLQSVDPSVKVLLISGYTADEEIREILKSDTVEFLEKPFLLADLAESMTRLTGSR